MIVRETYTLSNSVEIPKLGLGTWFISDREAPASIDGSLDALGLEYVDLMIIHSPQSWAEFNGKDRHRVGNREAWRALGIAHNAGKLRAIGVSNFEEADIDTILESCTVAPMVNQILAHITNTPRKLIEYCRSKYILIEGYSPVGHGELLKNRGIAAVAEEYGVSVPQLGIRYILLLGLVALPKTANPAHMRENADVDFVISDEDMERLQNMTPIQDYGEAGIFPIYQKRAE